MEACSHGSTCLFCLLPVSKNSHAAGHWSKCRGWRVFFCRFARFAGLCVGMRLATHLRQALWAEDLGEHRGQAWKDGLLCEFLSVDFVLAIHGHSFLSLSGVAIGWHHPAAACWNAPGRLCISTFKRNWMFVHCHLSRGTRVESIFSRPSFATEHLPLILPSGE